jgi:DNA end-binding protein Ku
MPNSIWTGSLSFGLVVVPVRLYPAIRKKHVRFRELDRYGRRVRHVRVSEPEYEIDRDVSFSAPPASAPDARPFAPPPNWSVSDITPAFSAPAPEVQYEEIRKGYEIAPGQYVSLTREEVAALAPEKSRVIDVEQFVNVADVDPIYFESRYHVVPDRASAKPFQLLATAMADAGRMAVGWITLRQRRYLSAIRPYQDLMLLTTMVHADEVVAADFWMPDEGARPTEKELKMAKLLIDTLSGPFDPEYFKDEHRERVLRAIEAKTPLELETAETPAPTKVMDLMAALEASVKAARAAKGQQEKQARAPRRRARNA